MEAQLIQNNTISVQNFAQSFFAKVPTDRRFLQTTLHKIMPSSTLSDSDVIDFYLERFEAGNLYMIQDTYVQFTCAIVQENGQLPATGKNISVINNLGHSMFSSVRIFLNDTNLSTSSLYYPYKGSNIFQHCSIKIRGGFASRPPSKAVVFCESLQLEAMSKF
jgi:hypothetical protein